MSKIFTKTELEEIELRLQGKKSNYKIWYRAKPKIKELLNEWYPQKQNLAKLINKEQKKHKHLYS